MKILTLAAFTVAASATLAFAHSEGMTTMPADGDVVQAAPSEIMFMFDDAIRLTRIEMIHASDPAVDLDLAGQQSFATEYTVPVTAVGDGTYQITWRGLGVDGHPVQGEFSFEVE